MPTSATMTIRIASETKRKLERLAADTRRSKSFLAAEAVAAYVERELAIIDGVQRGLADVEAGRVIPHDAAMAEIQAVIDTAKSGKA
ncbi:CopG family transcriptional regulator [Amaricoccus sp.]|uniref:CopG family ribbon-helix-helix protein n=1 Tax=Amaricoccus sp. TaxID=1872485 RepID=UPI00261205F5|nr:CopG family transcriptional regulator [Amaricoccus sp.]HRO10000.1 CopG family transcriptional regulator [Amaricoccus sp.]